jgi:hypothetical protein
MTTEILTSKIEEIVKYILGNIFSPSINYKLFRTYILVSIIFIAFSCDQPGSDWLKGNMHTHTLWSDGDEFPETVAKWYKEKGYDFLVITDHNTILEGQRWRNIPEDNPAFKNYLNEYSKDWVESQSGDEEGTIKVKLKTLNECRSRYEEPGKFLLIMGNEISNPHAVHLLAFQQNKIVPASKGTEYERLNMIQQTVANVASYRKETGINTWPVLAHPNFRWAITAEMIINTPSLRFFEVYNGHSQVNNEGDGHRAGTERIWDIVLANRLSSGGKILYGVATDDAHHYQPGDHYRGNGPGKGWVVVRAGNLDPDAILEAIDKGDFYASTGVTLKDLKFDGHTIKIKIEKREGIDFKTEFIGTLKGFDPSSTPATDESGNEIENTTRIYSDEIGKVIGVSNSLTPTYSFTGNELYVRVRITSSAGQYDPISKKLLGKQKAWIQPMIPGNDKK